MSSFVCIDPDTAAGTCSEWVQTATPLALTYSEGAQLATAVVTCWAIAWGFRLLVSHLLNR